MAVQLALGGYVALTVGAFLEGEVVLIVAGALARRGTLSLPLVVLAGGLGSCAWSEAWFYTGRAFGRRSIDERPAWKARVKRLEDWLARHATLCVLGFRFVAGMGTVGPILLGASGHRWRRFALLDLVGAASWAFVFGSLGWVLAFGLERALGPLLLVPQIFAAACVCGALLFLLGQRTIARIAQRAERNEARGVQEKPIG